MRPARFSPENNTNNIKPQPTGYKQARDNMNNTSNVTNTHNGHGFVDLGLPSGTLWATCNVGATSPEQAGLYFAFGEVDGFTVEQVNSGKRAFDEKSYKAKDISIIFSLKQDAANHYMGGKWRMPTTDEWQELIYSCNRVWTENYKGTGVKGSIFTSRVNGNSVFLPAAGYCNISSVNLVGSEGNYWSASGRSLGYAWCLYFYFGDQRLGSYRRCCGCSVRGVYKR